MSDAGLAARSLLDDPHLALAAEQQIEALLAVEDGNAPVARIGAANGISPQAEGLEAAFLPNAGDIAAAVRGLI